MSDTPLTLMVKTERDSVIQHLENMSGRANSSTPATLAAVGPTRPVLLKGPNKHGKGCLIQMCCVQMLPYQPVRVLRLKLSH